MLVHGRAEARPSAWLASKGYLIPRDAGVRVALVLGEVFL
jgi:hypothetical protein